jgi:hypothetical protein
MIGHIDLPPTEALPRAALVGVMIVVPTLAHCEERASSQLLRESSPVTYRLLPRTCARELMQNVA